MALEVYKYEFARYLAKKENKTILVILKDIEESLKLRDYRLIDELEDWIKDKPTLLNRQPTLHQYGMLAFNTKLSSDSTLKISPTCTSAYNADFDGVVFLNHAYLRHNTK
jgi:DNA-directed RNA polymerase beta' subunit